MSNHRDYVFVLWGEQFDVVAAAIFVTELRKMGLRVKVVGLGLRHFNGANELALVPDFNLDEVLSLAGYALCVIVPYPADRCQRFNNDPRLPEFFKRAAVNQCWFIVGPPVEAFMPEIFPSTNRGIMTYPEPERLVEFSGRVGRSLLGSFL